MQPGHISGCIDTRNSGSLLTIDHDVSWFVQGDTDIFCQFRLGGCSLLAEETGERDALTALCVNCLKISLFSADLLDLVMDEGNFCSCEVPLEGGGDEAFVAVGEQPVLLQRSLLCGVAGSRFYAPESARGDMRSDEDGFNLLK